MEPPRATPAARRPPHPPLLSVAARAQRSRDELLARPALFAAGALTISGRGDLWVAAFALGLADQSLWSAAAVALAAVGALARVGSAGFADLAGAQGVLGAAGWTGAPLVVLAAWCSGIGLLVVGRRRVTSALLGAIGALLVAGPTPSGRAAHAAMFVAAAGLGAAAGWFAAAGHGSGRRARWQPYAGVALAALGAVLAIASHATG